MSKRFGNGLALGLTLGIFGTILIGLLFETYPSESAQPDAQSNESGYVQPANNRWWLIGRVVYMDDTFAQWLMTLLTLAAVVMVYWTLRDTRQTMKDTRRIGEAQVRAYLSIPKVIAKTSLGADEITWWLDINIQNSGQSPARHVAITADIKRSKTNHGELLVSDIPAQTTAMEEKAVGCSRSELNFKSDDETSAHLNVTVRIRAQDVFGGAIEIEQRFWGWTELKKGAATPLRPQRALLITGTPKRYSDVHK